MMLDSSFSVLNWCSLSDDSIVLDKCQLQQLLFAADFVVDHMIQIIAVSVFLFKQTYLTQKMASGNISKKRGKYKKYKISIFQCQGKHYGTGKNLKQQTLMGKCTIYYV